MYYTDKNVKFSNDLFLKKVHMGKVQGQLNGNIYFDKPWTTRFVDRPDADFDISETLYKTYIKFANKNLNETAVYIAETEERFGEILNMGEGEKRGMEFV